MLKYTFQHYSQQFTEIEKTTQNPYIKGLSGFESLKSIGNGIEISRNGNTDGEIPTYGSTGRPGWCMVKAWIEDEIVKSTSDVILTYSDGELVDLSMLI